MINDFGASITKPENLHQSAARARLKAQRAILQILQGCIAPSTCYTSKTNSKDYIQDVTSTKRLTERSTLHPGCDLNQVSNSSTCCGPWLSLSRRTAISRPWTATTRPLLLSLWTAMSRPLLLSILGARVPIHILCSCRAGRPYLALRCCHAGRPLLVHLIACESCKQSVGPHFFEKCFRCSCWLNCCVKHSPQV